MIHCIALCDVRTFILRGTAPPDVAAVTPEIVPRLQLHDLDTPREKSREMLHHHCISASQDDVRVILSILQLDLTTTMHETRGKMPMTSGGVEILKNLRFLTKTGATLYDVSLD